MDGWRYCSIQRDCDEYKVTTYLFHSFCPCSQVHRCTCVNVTVNIHDIVRRADTGSSCNTVVLSNMVCPVVHFLDILVLHSDLWVVYNLIYAHNSVDICQSPVTILFCDRKLVCYTRPCFSLSVRIDKIKIMKNFAQELSMLTYYVIFQSRRP